MKDDLGIYSKYVRQQMKMIWTLPLQFFMQKHIDNEEDCSDHVGTYHGIRAEK